MRYPILSTLRNYLLFVESLGSTVNLSALPKLKFLLHSKYQELNEKTQSAWDSFFNGSVVFVTVKSNVYRFFFTNGNNLFMVVVGLKKPNTGRSIDFASLQNFETYSTFLSNLNKKDTKELRESYEKITLKLINSGVNDPNDESRWNITDSVLNKASETKGFWEKFVVVIKIFSKDNKRGTVFSFFGAQDQTGDLSQKRSSGKLKTKNYFETFNSTLLLELSSTAGNTLDVNAFLNELQTKFDNYFKLKLNFSSLDKDVKEVQANLKVLLLSVKDNSVQKNGKAFLKELLSAESYTSVLSNKVTTENLQNVSKVFKNVVTYGNNFISSVVAFITNNSIASADEELVRSFGVVSNFYTNFSQVEEYTTLYEVAYNLLSELKKNPQSTQSVLKKAYSLLNNYIKFYELNSSHVESLKNLLKVDKTLEVVTKEQFKEALDKTVNSVLRTQKLLTKVTDYEEKLNNYVALISDNVLKDKEELELFVNELSFVPTRKENKGYPGVLLQYTQIGLKSLLNRRELLYYRKLQSLGLASSTTYEDGKLTFDTKNLTTSVPKK